MADNQDNLSAKDQKMLEDLEKQLTQSAQKNTNSGTSGVCQQSQRVSHARKVMGNKAMPKSTNTNKVEPAPPCRQKQKPAFCGFLPSSIYYCWGLLSRGAYWGWMLWQTNNSNKQVFFAQQESCVSHPTGKCCQTARLTWPMQ